MRTLTCLVFLAFISGIASAQEPELPRNFFSGWNKVAEPHLSDFYLVESMERARLLKEHQHSEEDVRCLEVHFVNPENEKEEVIMVIEPSEEKARFLLIGYFVDRTADNGPEAQAIYLFNHEREIFAMVPQHIFPNGSWEQLTEYLHERLGVYIVLH